MFASGKARTARAAIVVLGLTAALAAATTRGASQQCNFLLREGRDRAMSPERLSTSSYWRQRRESGMHRVPRQRSTDARPATPNERATNVAFLTSTVSSSASLPRYHRRSPDQHPFLRRPS